MYFIIIMFSVALLIALFNSGRISRTRPPSLLTVQEWTRGLGSRIPFLSAFALTFLLLAAPAHAQVDSPGSQRQSLGSLNSAGEVFVNESQAPSELTIFSGDAVRTGETGTAILTTSGNNSLQISRRSQVVFTEDARYFAELKSGTIFVKSLGGAAGTVVRAGSFAVVPANRNVQTMVTIEKLGDGSYLLTCSAGNVGIVPLQEAPGLFLQAGQSARISPKGELVAEQAPAPASTPAAAQSAGRSNRLWLYLGLAGGGIAAGVAAAVASGGTHPPISPSSP
jgi:hypothetical protein